MKKLIYLDNDSDEKFQFIKRIGLWGFLFFAAKGLLWLVVSVSLFWFGTN